MDATINNGAGNNSKRRNLFIFIFISLLVGGLVYYFFIREKDDGDSSNVTACSTFTTQATCLSPCVWDGSKCTESNSDFKLTPEAKLADISNLSARYLPSGYDAGTKKWKDTNGLHEFEVQGVLTKAQGDTHVNGTTVTKFTLPSGLYDRHYTLFTVAKYNGASKKRIFVSGDDMWYSGHNDGKSGVAKRGDVLLTEDIDYYGDSWVVSCDQRNVYRANGIRLSGMHYDQEPPTTIGVNIASPHESDFAIGEILVYSRELNLDEIQIIEKILLDKYVVPPKTYFSGTVTNASKPDLYTAEVDCGANSALKSVSVLKKDGEDSYAHKYKCMFNMENFGNPQYFRENVEDVKRGEYMKDMLNQRIDCNTKALQGYKFRTSGDKISLGYTCAAGLVDVNTCENKNSEYMNAADIVAHVVECDDANKVLTSLRFRTQENDQTKGRYEYTCCKPKGY